MGTGWRISVYSLVPHHTRSPFHDLIRCYGHCYWLWWYVDSDLFVSDCRLVQIIPITWTQVDYTVVHGVVVPRSFHTLITFRWFIVDSLVWIPLLDSHWVVFIINSLRVDDSIITTFYLFVLLRCYRLPLRGVLFLFRCWPPVVRLPVLRCHVRCLPVTYRFSVYCCSVMLFPGTVIPPDYSYVPLHLWIVLITTLPPVGSTPTWFGRYITSHLDCCSVWSFHRVFRRVRYLTIPFCSTVIVIWLLETCSHSLCSAVGRCVDPPHPLGYSGRWYDILPVDCSPLLVLLSTTFLSSEPDPSVPVMVVNSRPSEPDLLRSYGFRLLIPTLFRIPIIARFWRWCYTYLRWLIPDDSFYLTGSLPDLRNPVWTLDCCCLEATRLIPGFRGVVCCWRYSTDSFWPRYCYGFPATSYLRPFLTGHLMALLLRWFSMAVPFRIRVVPRFPVILHVTALHCLRSIRSFLLRWWHSPGLFDCCDPRLPDYVTGVCSVPTYIRSRTAVVRSYIVHVPLFVVGIVLG